MSHELQNLITIRNYVNINNVSIFLIVEKSCLNFLHKMFINLLSTLYRPAK